MKPRVHIALSVENLGDSIKFYESLFGQTASKIKPDYANFRLDYPSIHLALTKTDTVTQGSPQSPSHFGIELETDSELSKWEQRVRDDELAILDDKGGSCCYAKADKFWVSDPDQNRWEVWVYKGEAESLRPVSGSCC